MLKVITFNAAILDVCFFGHSFHRPVGHIELRLRRLARALEESDADIVFLQEMFHRYRQESMCRMLPKCYPFVRGFASAGWKLRLGNELLVLSRFPISDGKLIRFKDAPAEELRHTSKGFYHVQSELPKVGNVNFINFHMSAGGKHKHPQSRVMEAIRQKQIEQLLDYTRGLNKIMLAGDLNAGPETSSNNYQRFISAGYHDLFAAVAAQGISWDPANPLVARGAESHLPAQRIDHVFADKLLFDCLQVIEAKIIFTDHCVITSDSAVPLSDHYGLSVNLRWGCLEF